MFMSGPLTSASTPKERTHVTRACGAHHPPAQTATCPIGLSKLTARRRRTLKRTVCGAAAARPPHTESLSGTSLKWLAKFTEHFHLCAPPQPPPSLIPPLLRLRTHASPISGYSSLEWPPSTSTQLTRSLSVCPRR